MAPTHQCPGCGSYQQGVLEQPVLVVCKQCHVIIVNNTSSGTKLQPKPMPEDWSFIRIGTTGTFETEQFAVVGRIRLQLLNDYKNVWTIVTRTGKTLQLVESFGSFSVFQPDWRAFDQALSKLRAGKSIPISSTTKYHGEYLEKSFDVHYEGEIAVWRHFHDGFFLVQCSDSESNTALFPFETKQPVQYLHGKKVTLDILKLSNTVTWDEWK
jgi:hypothetical protein